MKVKVFLGSSTEGRDDMAQIAEWIEAAGHDPVRWDRDSVFAAGTYILPALREQSRQVDAAAFIFGADDAVLSRDSATAQPRDNVLIEYGVFVSVLEERNVIVCRKGGARLASDIQGIVYVDISRKNAAERIIREWLDQVQRHKEAASSNVDVSEDDHRILSLHPVIDVISERIPGNARGNANVFALSTAGKQFFGYAMDVEASKWVGLETVKLLAQLQYYVDPPSFFWDDLMKDQDRVYKKFYAGEPAFARVPVRFNDQHPFFPNRIFIPVIVGSRDILNKDNVKCEISRVLYLDADKLPRYVFGAQIWEDVRRDVEPDVLAKELATIRHEWDKTAATAMDRARVTALMSAEDELAHGGSLKVLELCAKVGLFALLEIAESKSLSSTRAMVGRLLDRPPR